MIWKEHKQNIFTRDAMIQKKKTKKTEHKQNNSPKITSTQEKTTNDKHG